MKLNEIKATPGARRKRTRVGRGRSSGLGKTSGKGQKGQGAHNKHKKAGFEGGQTPMHRRFPKRGFSNIHRKDFVIVNVGQLEKLAGKGEITPEMLKKAGLIEGRLDGIRVLGEGELKSAITISATHFTKSAKEKIEKAGGKIIIVPASTQAPSRRTAVAKEAK
jgi:large subunit ribosomal protein L15